MATPPQFVAGRTCTVTVPVAPFGPGWFGFNYPAITDAGDFILIWGGVTYDQGDPNSIFYWNVVKIQKSDFTVALQTRVPLNGITVPGTPGPNSPYFTASAVSVSGSNVYVMGWFWTGAIGYYRVWVLDLATLTVQQTSNTVTIAGSSSVMSSGGTQRNSNAFIVGDYLIVGAQFDKWLFTYQISTNTLAANAGIAPDNFNTSSGWTVASDGKVYRLTPTSTPTITIDVCAGPTTPTFTNLSTIAYGLLSGNANSNASVYLDEANGLMYVHGYTLSSGFQRFWLQISTANGSVVNAIADSGFTDSSVNPEFGWNGFGVAQDDNAFIFYLRDADNNLTAEPGIALPLQSPGPVSTPFDTDFYDMLLVGSGCGDTIYGCLFTNDLNEGDIVTFYEYTAGGTSTSLCEACGTPPLGDPFAECGGVNAQNPPNMTLPLLQDDLNNWIDFIPSVTGGDGSEMDLNLNDGLSMTDEYSTGGSFIAFNVSDMMGTLADGPLAPVPGNPPALTIAIIDPMTMTDGLTGTGRGITRSDTLTMNSAVTKLLGIQQTKTVTDTMTLTDAVAKTLA